jgi:hypothetical protein
MKRSLAVFLLVCLAAGMAHADIDHRCLNKCVNDGGSAASCLPSCEVVAPSAVPALPSPGASEAGAGANRVLSVPTSIKQGTPLNAVPPTTPAPEKDYACVRACLADRNSFSYCEKVCAKVCPAAAVLCPAPVYNKR